MSTPVPARSRYIASAKPHIAYFAALYADSFAIGMRPPMLDTNTIVPASAVDHPREHRERHAHGGVEVDVHDVLDVVGREIGDVCALRDRGVVDERVEAAERVPRLDRDLLGAGEIAEVGGPHLRLGRVLAALGEHLAQPLLAAGDDADGRAALRRGSAPARHRCPTTRR